MNYDIQLENKLSLVQLCTYKFKFSSAGFQIYGFARAFTLFYGFLSVIVVMHHDIIPTVLYMWSGGSYPDFSGILLKWEKTFMGMFRKVLTGSRFLIIISVLGTLIGSIIFQHQFSTNEVKIVAASSVELIDLFLLSTILYIVSLGLYKLFIDGELPLPSRLIITDLNDLKERILGGIMVLLAISFLGYLVEWHFGDYSIVAVGVAVALVLFAVGYWLTKGALSGQLASEIQKEKRNGENQMVDTQK